MKPIYSFVAQLFLFTSVMTMAHVQFDEDDIRTQGVHLRILICVFQVMVLQIILISYIAIVCVVRVVKHDRRSFVIVNMPSATHNPRHTQTLNVPDVDEMHESSTVVQAECEASRDAEAFSQETLSIKSDSESDKTCSGIIFETQMHLDLYVLYVNFIGVLLWQTMMCFNFCLYNTNLLFLSGLLLGWFSVQILTKSDQRDMSASYSSCYMFLSTLITILCFSGWHHHDNNDIIGTINLLIPSFVCGMCWTAVTSRMAFTGTGMRTKGIYNDSIRAIPTFMLVMTVSALYSAPDTRAEVFTYIKSLSRMATVHLLLVEPINKFICIYVTIICLERQQTTNVTVALIVVQGLSFFIHSDSHQTPAILTLVFCVLLVSVHVTQMSRNTISS